MSRITSPLSALLLPIPGRGLSACATDRPVRDAQEISDGPSAYVRVSVPLDRDSVR